MPELGSDDWRAAYLEAQAKRPVVDGADATVKVTFEGGPGGKVVFVEELVDGRATSAEPGNRKGCDLELSAKWDIAEQVYRGQVDPNVPFMQGRLKVAGDYRLWLRLARALADPDFRAGLAAIPS